MLPASFSMMTFEITDWMTLEGQQPLTEQCVHLWKAHQLPPGHLSSVAACAPLLRFYLGETYEISRNDNGKPIAYSDSNELHSVQFNLSHTKDAFCIAFVKHHMIGIDVESLKSERDWTKLAKRFFSPEEFNQMEQAPAELQKDVFFRLWTLKEAMIKCLGVSLFTGLPRARFETSFATTMEPVGQSIKLIAPSSDDQRLMFMHQKDTHYFSMALTPFVSLSK